MRHLFLPLIFMLCFSIQLLAKPIEKEEAKGLAINFYSYNAPDGVSDFSVKDIFTNSYNNKNTFYTFVFNAGGFVIISADDNAYPILGYSFDNTIDRNSKNSSFLYKLEKYSRQIDNVSALKSRSQEVAQLWDNLKNKSMKLSKRAAGPLLSTTWDQSPYYNMYSPNGTPTGCVATAMAQIMNYHQWPTAGTGFNSYIPKSYPTYGKQSVDFESTTYDWVNMPDNLNESSTETQKEAIAELMYHCGVSVNMDFKPLGSGAFSNDVLNSMSNYFLYDENSIEIISFDVNNQTEWINLIKNEIDQNRPVYYDGSDVENGGHAWICDGYNDNNYLHINWGWGGSSNGYFRASAMSPGTYTFTESNSIIIGIKPGNPNHEIKWTKQASGFATASRGVRYISAIDERTAWAVGFDGSENEAKVKEYTRTTNGGETWTYGTINAPSSLNYESAMICAIDQNTAWVPLFGPSGGGKIVKTTDGGKTWVNQSTATFLAPSGFPNVIHFWDENNGFCMGDPNNGYFEIYTTTNGGDAWNRVEQANIPSNNIDEAGTIGYFDVVADTVWFGTSDGRLFRSINKGLNWQAFQTPITNANFEVSFKNARTGIIQKRHSSEANTAYITQNGGETWTLLNNTGNFYNNDFLFIPGSDLIISTGSDYATPFMGISYSNDDGQTFSDYAPYYKNYQFLSIGSAGENSTWVGAYGSGKYEGGMWHLGLAPITSVFSADKTQICSTDEVVLADKSTGFPNSWTWNFGEGATPSIATGQGPHIVSYSTEGGKNVSLTISKGSEENTQIIENLYHVSNDIPTSPSAISGNTSVSAGQKYTYSVDDILGISFTWKMPTNRWGGTSTTNSIQVSFSSYAKSDTLKVLAKNGCGISDTTKLFIEVTGSLGIEDVSDADDLNVYPNPAKEKIYIKNINKTEIQIVNSEGKLVLTQKINSDKDAINISKLPSGIYYIGFSDKNKKIYQPFSKI